MKNRFFSFIIALSMLVTVFSILPFSAIAADSSALTEAEKTANTITVKQGVADGTSVAPIQIWTAGQLSDFAAKVNSGEKVSGSDRYYTQAHAILMADIAFNVGYTYELTDAFAVKVTDPSGKVSYLGTGRKGTVATWYTDAACTTTGVADGFTKPSEWTPIGATKAQAYLSTFDGNNHKISGIFYAKNETASAGLFGYAGTNAVDKVVLKNISLVGACIVSAGSTGGIAGYLYNNINDPTTTSSKCDHSDGVCERGFKNSLSATSEQKGYNDILHFTVSGCNNVKSVVSSTANNVGGIVGESGNTYHYATNCNYRNSNYGTTSNAVMSCTNSSTVLGKGYVGGIIGNGALGCFDGSVNKGSVFGTSNYVAGIAGSSNNSTLKNLTNHGNITSTGSYVAGITAYSNRLVNYALNTGKITGATSVAGILAIQNETGSGHGVQYVANLGEVYATTSNAAGIVSGYSKALVASKISNVYNYASVSAKSANTAAAIALVSTDSTAEKVITIENVFSVGGTPFVDLSGKGHLKTSSNDYSNEITEAQVKDGTLLSKLSGFKKLESYPYPIPANTVVTAELSGSGTDADPYKIYTSADLYEFASRVNSGYVDELGNAANPCELSARLMDDIQLNVGYKFELVADKGLVKVTKDGLSAYVGTGIKGSGIAVWYKDTSLTVGTPDGFVKPNEWTPIGVSNTTNYFGGNLEGNGHTVSGMFVAKNESYVGLIGYAGGIGSDTTVGVSNLTVKDSVVIGKSNVGALAGAFVSNIGDNSTSSSSSNMCNHSENPNCKRGQNVNCVIKHCHNDNTIVTATGGVVGGLIGYGGGGANHYYITNSNSTPTRVNNYGAISSIEYCSNSGEVLSSGKYTAGIIGDAARVRTLQHVTNSASITSSADYTAGIMGKKTWGDNAAYLINTGDITGADYTAGIVGSQERSVSYCLNTGKITGKNYSAGIIAYQAIAGNNYSPSFVANTGNVTASGSYAAGLVSRLASGTVQHTISSSYNAGKITASSYQSSIIATMNTTNAAAVILTNVYSTGGEAIACNGKNVTLNKNSSYNNSITLSQVASGELAMMLGSNYGQSATDPCPIPGSTDVIKWAFAGGSLDLVSNIKLKLYLAFSSDIKSSDTVKLTVGEKHLNVNVSDIPFENGYAVITVSIAAKEMGDTVSFALYSGSNQIGRAFNYSVKQYAEDALSESSQFTADGKALVASMLNYGGASQRYFDYNTDNCVSDTVTVSEIESPTPRSVIEGDVTYVSSTLVLEGEIKLRHYFLCSANDTTFTVNGKTVRAYNKGVHCYVEIPISVTAIGETYTVCAGTTTVEYSVLNYLYNMQNDKELSELVDAIYDYYAKALKYGASISALSFISIDGLNIKGFSPDVKTYDVTVISDGEYPEIKAAASVFGATVEIEQASAQNGGVATITVTSIDGQNTNVYKVNITMAEHIDVNATIEKAKDGADSIVVIVHDDGDQSTGSYLADEFQKNDLRGTIALITNKVCTVDSNGNRTKNQSAIDFWQSILDTGRFSMSSHTRTHTYWGRTDAGDSGTYYSVAGNPDTLRDYTTTPGQITREVAGSQDDLRVCFPGQRVLTFVKAGFGVNTDGSQITAEATEIIKQYYITMRNTGGGVDTIPAANPYSIKSYMVNNSDSSELLVSYTETAISQGGMIVYLFHGISGNLRTEASELFAYLGAAQKENKVWVADFEQASLYTEEYRTASVSAKRYSDRIEVTLTDEWDNTVYNHALTVRVEVPENWTSATQTVGGESVTLEVQHDKDGYFVYANIIPDSGVAVISAK